MSLAIKVYHHDAEESDEGTMHRITLPLPANFSVFQNLVRQVFGLGTNSKIVLTTRVPSPAPSEPALVDSDNSFIAAIKGHLQLGAVPRFELEVQEEVQKSAPSSSSPSLEVSQIVEILTALQSPQDIQETLPQILPQILSNPQLLNELLPALFASPAFPILLQNLTSCRC